MLLSLYVSFRLSSDLAQERVIYVLSITGFIIVVSFLSTFVCMLWDWVIFLYPFWLVSFPFFSIPEFLFNDPRTLLTSYKINFFGIEIVSISPQNLLVCGLSFFLAINLIGAMLGYWINRKFSGELFKWKLFDSFFRNGILSFLVCYTILWLNWFALDLIVWYRVDDIWFTIVGSITLFCRYFFWLPALITAIYEIYKRPRKDKSEKNLVDTC